MSEFFYTEAQKKAIHLSGQNLLISAGAGSGKTTVLTERVIEKILAGISIESLLVLTFTNAAAKEMKERIHKKLKKKDNSEIIKKALNALDSSHICTFDSFALFIVRKYGYLRNLSKSVAIADSIRLKIVRQNIIDEIFMEYYQNQYSPFLDYVSTYEIKRDQTLKEQIIFFHQQLLLHDDYALRLKYYINEFTSQKNFEYLFNRYEQLIFDRLKAIKEGIEDLYNHVDSGLSIAFIDAMKEHCKKLVASTSYDQVVMILKEERKFPNSSSTTRGLKQAGFFEEQRYLDAGKKAIQENLKSLATGFCTLQKEAHQKAFFDSQKHIPIVVEIIERFIEKLQIWQYENEVFDFASIAHIAHKLIQDNDSVLSELKQSIHEVMIDEYQDTNPLQDSFIQLLTQDNVYMVGDIKQSIYRFRHADPQIFINRYKEYQETNAGIVIDLYENYRSRKPLLEGINQLFFGIMDDKVGGVDYTTNQRLVYGKKAYDNLYDPNHNEGLKIHVIDIEGMEDQLKDYQLNEKDIEIFHIAQDINQKVNHMMVFDHKTETMRFARYEDFAVLINVSAEFDRIREIFTYHKIPLKTYRSDPFMNYHDIDVYRHLLKGIYALRNQKYYQEYFKHSFLSLSRSYLFDFSDDDIISMIIDIPENSDDIMQAVVKTSFEEFVSKLKHLADYSRSTTLPLLWKKIVESFKLYPKLVKLPLSQQAKARLDYLGILIEQLSLSGYYLEDLVQYFDHIVSDSLEVEFDTSSSVQGDYVNLMTIHKAKGLEFPIVYLPHMGRTFNQSHSRSYGFDYELGFLLEHEEDGLTKSFLFSLKNEIEITADISERLRVLYVALTRAKETCIVPIIDKTPRFFRKQDNGVILAYDRVHQYKSYKDVFVSMFDQLEKYIHSVDMNQLILATLHPKNPYDVAYQSTHDLLTYQSLEIPKISLSERSFSGKINRLLNKSQLDNITQGNIVHHYFELIDFKKDTHQQIQNLTSDKKIHEILHAFFNQPLIQSLDIIQVYKEFPFDIDYDEGSYRGYIDLLIETKDQFVIIDYKLKHVDKEEYATQIKGYENVLKQLSNKKISGYLYSIINQEFFKIL